MERSHRASGARSLRILQSVRRVRPTTNPYIAALIEKLGDVSSVSLFSWRQALFGRYDVIHIHWPELLFVRPSRLRRLSHSAALLILIIRVRSSRIAVVRTLHNSAPHESQTRSSVALLDLLDRSVTVWIALNSATNAPMCGEIALIRHPHYRDWFREANLRQARPGRIAFFGLIRDYKNVDGLISAFRDVRDPSVSLAISGSVQDAKLATRLEELVTHDDRVTLQLTHLSDQELAGLITESQLIVLPYREMLNSGALLLALSLNRPVVVPDNEATRELAGEVGEGWILRYRGDLSAQTLIDALAITNHTPADTPDLSRREWPAIVDAHLAVYRRAVNLRHEA